MMGSRTDIWLLHASSLLVAGTGLVYGWMRYFATPLDAYAVVRHPWQPLVQHLHVWLAPALVFSVGLIWRGHIWKRWSDGVKVRRRSGLTLMLNWVPMVLSGYLIQTAVSSVWRQVWVGVHLSTSLLWVSVFLLHLLIPLRLRLRRRALLSQLRSVSRIA